MAIFKLKRDCMHETWWRDYYEIEAESIEDAIQNDNKYYAENERKNL